ncbi:hypothetical protein [Novosphingopyxis sp.]|uniref:hypothetical protein n=1 Tax=Novosphingopyxis sp. TaxID=2709690 RepID=UPI003B5B8857
MKSYTILDSETRFDPYLEDAYKAIDPKCEKARIASCKLDVVAMLDVDLDDEGRLSVGPLASWTAEDGGERPLLSAAFFHLQERPDRQLVTYGGSAVDAKVIELAAMSHDLALPIQLREQFGPRREARHLDLGQAIKGFSKTWHHLTEILLRMGVPVALIANKAKPMADDRNIDWRSAREHCELDTLLTAMALIAWRRVQGDPCLHIPTASYALISGYLHQRPEGAMASLLRREAAHLAGLIAADMDLAA